MSWRRPRISLNNSRSYLHPIGITSQYLVVQKESREEFRCMSHDQAKYHLHDPTLNTIEFSYYPCRSNIVTVPNNKAIVGATLQVGECSLDTLCDPTLSVSFELNGNRLFEYNIPLLILLSRTNSSISHIGLAEFSATKRRLSAYYRLLRMAGLAKLLTDTILFYLILQTESRFVSAPFICGCDTDSRSLRLFRRLFAEIVDSEAWQTTFSVPLALPIGTRFPERELLASHSLFYINNDTDNPLAWRLLVDTIDNTIFTLDHDTTTDSRDQVLLKYKSFDQSIPWRVSNSEYRVLVRQNLPGIALLAYFKSCAAIDTIEICFERTLVNTCAAQLYTYQNDTHGLSHGYRLVYNAHDCRIRQFCGFDWFVLPIDRRMSIQDALHANRFEECCDFVDLTRIEIVVLRFYSSTGERVELPDTIWLTWRHFNILMTRDGVCGLAFNA